VTIRTDLAPAPADGDSAWLARAIGNLVHNAIKFSPAGATVTVVSATAGDEALVHVLDEGPGIPAEAREVIFDRFHRLDVSRARTTGGTGIGLSIVREILNAHGGRVWNEPAHGGGTRFVIALPQTATADRAEEITAMAARQRQ
jgi:two-component system OmpR family sensor kinase